MRELSALLELHCGFSIASAEGERSIENIEYREANTLLDA